MPTHIDDVCIWCQYASEKRKTEDLQAQVDRLHEIIRLNGICYECGDGIQDYTDSDGNSTCGCKAKVEGGLADHPVHKVFNAVFPEGKKE